MSEKKALSDITREEILETLKYSTTLRSLASKYRIPLRIIDDYAYRSGIMVHKEINASRIRRALRRKVRCIKSLSDAVKMKPSNVIDICEEYKIELPFIVIPKHEILNTIQKKTSLEPLIDKYGVSVNKVIEYARIYGITVNKEIKLAKIKKALNSGVTSMRELCDTVELSSEIIDKYCKKNNIELPFEFEYIFRGRIPVIDRLAAKALSGPKIGAAVNWSRERVRQYLKGTGQHEAWKKKREEKKRETVQVREHFYLLMRSRMFQLARKEGWPTEAALYCYLTPRMDKRKLRKFHKYKKLFSIYEQALLNNEKITLEEMAKNAGFKGSVAVRLLLSRVGLKPFYYNEEKNIKWRIAMGYDK
ncbi:hypothetical protein AYK26_06200 [Euryarchaeota archaeon SM23-78]|nr:MAG: hypothetical protein AYK26_06200 [Euryarchaeota archaeon SM23-78]MBW3001218.1 hypothetical protein [Candidatus Woesearchaeota archaeon]